jgi:thymidylate synthase
MKRKGTEPVSTTDLPAELATFRWEDWTREDDPPPWDESKFETCTEHHRRGCAPCGTGPLMWTSDKRYSEMRGRYHLAVEAWAFKHGMTADEIYTVINGDGALWTG